MDRPGEDRDSDDRPWMVAVSEGRVMRLWRSTDPVLDKSARENTSDRTTLAIYRVDAGLPAPPEEGQPVNPLERGWQRIA